MKNKNDNLISGYLLVESLIAMSIITIGLTGVMSLLNSSLSLNRIINDRFVGNYLAMEGIEIVKNIVDANVIKKAGWNASGLEQNGCFEVDYADLSIGANPVADCLEINARFLKYDSSKNIYGYDTGDNTFFRRRIKISHPINDELKVNSIVSWISRGGGKFEVSLEDNFFNWTAE